MNYYFILNIWLLLLIGYALRINIEKLSRINKVMQISSLHFTILNCDILMQCHYIYFIYSQSAQNIESFNYLYIQVAIQFQLQISYQLGMSNYSKYACGLPSKPRCVEPSMFQIMSWAGEDQLTESQFHGNQVKITNPVSYNCVQTHNAGSQGKQNLNQAPLNTCACTDYNSLAPQNKQTNGHVYQVYKEHKSSQKSINVEQDEIVQSKCQVQNNLFKKSALYPKQIKNCLYSYQPVNLKATRSKSVALVKRSDVKQAKKAKKEQKVLDQEQTSQIKKRIKQFQVFTRALPNSSFTTYYGKPAFQNYGRGTSCKNLKSFNVMPHKGDNHPKHLQSHYTALMKGRNIKSKSYMPRKPVEQTILPSGVQKWEQSVQELNLPLQKPDLVHSNRFATVVPDMGKKAGPPIFNKAAATNNAARTAKMKEPKATKTIQNKCKNQKGVTIKQNNDGLKFMNRRDDLIDLLEQKKLKASQLAFKVTECYPLFWENQSQNLHQCQNPNQNMSLTRPAGKKLKPSDHVCDIMQYNPLKQTNCQTR